MASGPLSTKKFFDRVELCTFFSEAPVVLDDLAGFQCRHVERGQSDLASIAAALQIRRLILGKGMQQHQHEREERPNPWQERGNGH